MQAHNIDAICVFAKKDEKAEFLFVYLANKDNNDLFTKTVTLANIFKSNKIEFDRNKLTRFLKDLRDLGVGEFEQHWNEKSGFRWSVKTKEFFGKLVNEGKI